MTSFLLHGINGLENAGVFVFSDKYLWSCGCSGTNCTVAVNCRNPKTEIQI